MSKVAGFKFLAAAIIVAGVAGGVLPESSAAVPVAAQTWLPSATEQAGPDSILRELSGRIRPLVCQYNGAQLQAATPFVDGKATGSGAQWSCELRMSDKPGYSEPQLGKGAVRNSAISGNASDLTLSFKVLSGDAASAGVAVAFDFGGWSAENYILVPAQIYGGNRFRVLPVGYPPYIHDPKQRPLDMPVTVTDIVRLNPEGAHGRAELNTGNVATPMMSFFNPQAKRGFILLTEQQTRFGNSGLIIEEDAGPSVADKRASFVVSAPGVRSSRYVMCGCGASPDRGAAWKTGDEVTLKFKLYNFACADMAAFYAKVFDVRKALSGANTYACVTPYSACADLILDYHNRGKWFQSGTVGYYSNRPGGVHPYHNQIGWNGVPILSFPQLISGTPERLQRVALSFDNTFMKAQGKTGLYYMGYLNGQRFGDVHGHLTTRSTIAMTRRSADVLYFGLRSLMLMKKRGQADMIKPEWEASLRRCADGLVTVWKEYGQLGQFIDVETGRMEINGSTAGCAAGAGLTLAADYFKQPAYLEVAEAATKMYYERDFLKGYAGGGAAEILQSPDSEAPWDMVESCMVLYEATGKRDWLARAEFATQMLATWMVSYDYAFPKGSGMERADVHAAGAFFASSQNNHGAPGYYILSGDMLLKLFRSTGDKRYAAMYKDTSHNVVQYVGAPHNALGKPSGFVTERVQLSDWEGGDVGSVNIGDSNMAWEVLAALTCLENPGIYLHTDDETFLVMDHVEAKVVKRDASGVTLSITNPTKYDARVSVFAESSAQAKKPLGVMAFDNWPKVAVKAGETKTITVRPDGSIQ